MCAIAIITRLKEEIKPLLTAFCPINKPPTVIITFCKLIFGDFAEESLRISNKNVKKKNSRKRGKVDPCKEDLISEIIISDNVFVWW